MYFIWVPMYVFICSMTVLIQGTIIFLHLLLETRYFSAKGACLNQGPGKEAVSFKFSWPRNDPEKVRIWRVVGGGGVLGGSPSLFLLQSNLSTMATLGTERKWPMWRGGHYGEVGVKFDNFFLGSTTCLSSWVHAYCIPLCIYNNIIKR